MGLLAQEEKALKIRAATLIVRQKEHEQRENNLAQKQRHRRLLRLELSNIIESIPFIFFLFLLGLFLGTILGINNPNAVACKPTNSLCQKFRWAQPFLDY